VIFSYLREGDKKKSIKSLVERKKVVLLQSQNGRNEALEKRRREPLKEKEMIFETIGTKVADKWVETHLYLE
jgi:hypothetical protein